MSGRSLSESPASQACNSPLVRFVDAMSGSKDVTSIKKAAARLVRELPDTASWDDLMHEIFVRQKIDAGLADLREGRTHSHDAIRKEHGFA